MLVKDKVLFGLWDCCFILLGWVYEMLGMWDGLFIFICIIEFSN